MMPVVFRIPFLNWDVPGYGLMLTVGFLLSVIWAARRAVKSQANPDVVLNCAFIALLGGVAGARLMFVWHYWREFSYRGHWLDILIAIFDVRKGGLEVYGGVILAMLGAFIYLVGWRHSVRWYLDIMAPSLALGMGIGRIGCLLNGCCWGNVCDLPWALRFPFGSNAVIEQWSTGKPGMDLPKELIVFAANGIGWDGQPAYPLSREVLTVTKKDIAEADAAATKVLKELTALQTKLSQTEDPQEKARLRGQMDSLAARRAAAASQYGDIRGQMKTYGLTLAQLQNLARQYYSQPVHPTQLYSTIGLVLLALLLDAVYWRRTRDGQVICTLLLVEPWMRYTLELLRADNPVDTLGRFTISQFLALTLSALGLIGFVVLHKLPPRSPRARIWVPPEEETAPATRRP